VGVFLVLREPPADLSVPPAKLLGRQCLECGLVPGRAARTTTVSFQSGGSPIVKDGLLKEGKEVNR
jgi:hypothetical protein